LLANDPSAIPLSRAGDHIEYEVSTVAQVVSNMAESSFQTARCRQVVQRVESARDQIDPLRQMEVPQILAQESNI
jgi:hypothetical protein